MRYTNDWADYELIDCSCGEKLERWGSQILVRPDPQVIWKSEKRISFGILQMHAITAQARAAANGSFSKRFLPHGKSNIKI